MKEVSLILLLVAATGASATKSPAIKSQEFSCRSGNESQSILSLNAWRVDEALIATSSCEAFADSSSEDWFVRVQLTGEGAEKLLDFSRSNLQKVTTIEINGIEHGTPIIKTPLSSGVIRIIDNFGQGEACQIARTIPKPCP